MICFVIPYHIQPGPMIFLILSDMVLDINGYIYSSEASFELIHPKKKVCACARVHACTRVRLLLVLVCGIMYHIRTYLISARLPR